MLGFRRGQHRGRLVEDDDAGLVAETLDDLDPLPYSGGEVAHEDVRVDLEAVPFCDFGDAGPGVRRVESFMLAQGYVLPDGQRVDQAVVLVDHSDAASGRRHRVDVAAGLTFEQHRSAVGEYEADDHLHQR